MIFESLNTERLTLRKITPETYAYVHSSYSDKELMKFFGLESDADLEKEKLKFRNGLTSYNKSFLWFHILDGKGKNIGWCGYHTWFTQHARAEIGYGMNTDEHKGKGFMTEALEAVFDYGFYVMKLHRVEALIADYNKPSLKLVEKFGFTKEGVLREHYYVDGKPEDSVLFSLLKQEYVK